MFCKEFKTKIHFVSESKENNTVVADRLIEEEEMQKVNNGENEKMVGKSRI